MTRSMRIIVNPISGRGRGLARAREVAAALGSHYAVEIVCTERAGHAREIAGRPGADIVVAVGGDGTVNEVLNGLPQPFPVLAVLPSGTGNTLAKELRMPRDPRAIAEMFRVDHEITWDLAIERPTGKRFLLFLSAGYDAGVVHRFHAQREGPIHQWEYFLWGLKSMVGFRPPRISVEIDGRLVTDRASWVQISNVAAYGGPLIFTPDAKPDDGALEVMVYHARQPRDTFRMFLRAGLRFFVGTEYGLHDLSFHKARSVKLGGDGVPVQIDGDPGGFLPAEIEIMPGGIRVLSPSRT